MKSSQQSTVNPYTGLVCLTYRLCMIKWQTLTSSANHGKWKMIVCITHLYDVVTPVTLCAQLNTRAFHITSSFASSTKFVIQAKCTQPPRPRSSGARCITALHQLSEIACKSTPFWLSGSELWTSSFPYSGPYCLWHVTSSIAFLSRISHKMNNFKRDMSTWPR